jgi:integrase
MTYSELGADGVWAIPAERYKSKRPNFVPLSRAALAIIEAQPKVSGCDYVFVGRTKQSPFSGFGKGKMALDRVVATGASGQPLPHWTLHDLRRTAKTLMVRAGVRPDISERVLGHAIAGVEGTYDRYSYLDEKRDALERLSTIVERILDLTPAANIVELRA